MSKPGTITEQPSGMAWAKHLRPFGKREAAKKDRKDARLLGKGYSGLEGWGGVD